MSSMEKKWALGNRKDSILNRQYFEMRVPVSIFYFFERTTLERERERRRRRREGRRKRERGR